MWVEPKGSTSSNKWINCIKSDFKNSLKKEKKEPKVTLENNILTGHSENKDKKK